MAPWGKGDENAPGREQLYYRVMPLLNPVEAIIEVIPE